MINSYKPFAPHPPAGQFSSCIDLNGSIFEKSGSELIKALKCANASGGAPTLERLASTIDQAKLSGDLAALLKYGLVDSPYVSGSLSEMQTLFQAGTLSSLLKLVGYTGDYGLPYMMDGILRDNRKSVV